MSEAPLPSGTVVGRYQICRQIGAGGMGEVYAAIDTSLGREVALKILPAHLTTDRLRVERFIKEAKSASALNHPAIVTVYEIGTHELDDETGGTIHYMAMELVAGRTLGEWLDEEPALSEVLEQLARIAQAVGQAHARGVVHRDLKPDNIMVTHDGYTKLLDFGLAKLLEPAVPGGVNDGNTGSATLTRPSTLIGTIGYMSPEQVEGLSIDHRSDIFGLGCIVFEAVAGKAPFTGETNAETLHAIVHREPEPVEFSNHRVDQLITRILDRALAKESSRRYDSALDLALDLEEAATMAGTSRIRAAGSRILGRRLTPRVVASLVVAIALVVFPATAVVDSVRGRRFQEELQIEREKSMQLELALEERERRIVLQDLEIERLERERQSGESLRNDLEQSYRDLLEDVTKQAGVSAQLRRRLQSAESDLEHFRETNDVQIRQSQLRRVHESLSRIAETELADDHVTVTIPGIVFRTGRSNVAPEAGPIVEAVAVQLKENPEIRVTIEGHADSNGNSMENLALSRDRAGEIARNLIAAGIESDRISTIGHGEMVPLFSNDTRRSRILNRRVELVLSH